MAKTRSTTANRSGGVRVWQHKVSAPEFVRQFLDCYTAALRGAAAVIEAAPISTARARSRNAWVLLTKAAPELEAWAEYFSGYSATRAAVLAGLSRAIDLDMADDFYRQVGRFLHVVEEYIGADSRLDPVGAHPRSMTA